MYTEDLKTAIRILHEGGVVVYPTDTVWGIGCDARQVEAVDKVYRLKRRDDSKALITLVADEKMLAEVTGEPLSEAVKEFIAAQSGRSVTVVYPHGQNVASNLLASDGSIGIRIVREGFAHDLCHALGGPIVSTSANISGQPTARTYSEISSEVTDAADYVCMTDRTGTRQGTPSIVVKITADGSIVILRK